MKKPLKLYDTVALLKKFSDKKVVVGQVGTIVEKYSETEFEVEFSDNSGQTIAMFAVETNDIMLLHYKLEYA